MNKNRFHLDPVHNESRGVKMLTKLEVIIFVAIAFIQSMNTIVKDGCLSNDNNRIEIKRPCNYLGLTTDKYEGLYFYVQFILILIIFIIEIAILVLLRTRDFLEKFIFNKLYKKVEGIHRRKFGPISARLVDISVEYPDINSAMQTAFTRNDMRQHNEMKFYLPLEYIQFDEENFMTKRIKKVARKQYTIRDIVEHTAVLLVLIATWMIFHHILNVPHDHFIKTLNFVINRQYDEKDRQGIFAYEVQCRVPYYTYLGKEQYAILVDHTVDVSEVATESFIDKIAHPNVLSTFDDKRSEKEKQWIPMVYYMVCNRNRSYIYFVVFGCLQMAVIAHAFLTVFSLLGILNDEEREKTFRIN